MMQNGGEKGGPGAQTEPFFERRRGRCWVALADASALPFAANSFDALSHADLAAALQNASNQFLDCRLTVTTGHGNNRYEDRKTDRS